MEVVRFGLSVRALRRRRGWSQAELGTHAGCSRSAIARIERGAADRFTVRLLERVLTALDARLIARVLWRGEELDRLLDADHAALVGATTRLLAGYGWDVQIEVTFQIYGERGSIDILAVRQPSDAALVVEVKSVVPDLQSMLASLDRKVRLAPTILRERGLGIWSGRVSRLLVLPGDRTSRRRVDRHDEVFGQSLRARTVEARRWLRDPSGILSGIMFLSGVTGAGARQRAGRGRRTA